MKFSNVFLVFGMMIFLSLACRFGGGAAAPIPDSPPSETLPLPPSVIPRQPRTPTPPSFFLPPTPAAAPSFPAWVADFSDPILAALTGRKPDFEDEFLNFNKGWFYFIPESPKGPYYAHIENEALLLKLPAENEKRDYWVYNPRLLRNNFALRFEFRFLESQPGDTMRLQFDESSRRDVAFDLSKSQTWTLRWGSLTDKRSLEGSYAHFPPDPIEVLAVVKGLECAFYLNGAPLAYLPDCRAEPTLRPAPWALTFHILAEPGHTASTAIDNLKFWDLAPSQP